MKKYILAPLVLCLAAGVSWAGPHQEAMRSLNTGTYQEMKIKTSGIEYTVNYSSTSRSVDVDQIKEHIEESTRQILQKAKSMNISTNSCRNLTVNMYEIPYGHLNNRSIMTFIEPQINYLIDGLYDSRYSDRGTASIFIANDVTEMTRKRAITHEISHYLSDIMCMNICSESFATLNE